MILIGDIGSTSSTWAFLTASGTHTIVKFAGYNPIYHGAEQLTQVLRQLSALENTDEIEKVFYYGTGVISVDQRHQISHEIKQFFAGSTVLVQSDLLGAVHGTCQKDPGIVCILGTGSNACFFDGQKVQSLTPSLGYMLGDEGSGCAIGKQFIKDYYYNRLPNMLQESFADLLPETKNAFLEKLRTHKAPNRYLAQFFNPAIEHIDHPYVHQVVKAQFSEFVDIHITPYSKEYPIHGIGSVAFGCKEILESVCRKRGYKLESVSQSPMKGLIEYHSKEKNNVAGN